MPSTRLPRTLAFAAAMAVTGSMTFAGTAFAADTVIDFGKQQPGKFDQAGSSKDTFVATPVKGVAKYTVVLTGGREDRTITATPSSAKVSTQGATKVVLTPVAAKGYALPEGTLTFELTFDTKAEAVTATAPDKTDLAGRKGDKILITPAAHVNWQLNDGKPIVVSGSKPVSVAVPGAAWGADNAGAKVTVKAVPESGDYSVDLAPTVLEFADKAEITIPEAAVVAGDKPGVTKDAVTVSYVTGVKWTVNNKPVSPREGKPVTVVASATPKVQAGLLNTTDYVFAKGQKTLWERADLKDLTDDKDKVEAIAPAAADAALFAKDTITLTGTTGIAWQIENGPADRRVKKTYVVPAGRTSKVPAGDNPVVTASAATVDYEVTGTARWTAADLTLSSGKLKITPPEAPAVAKDEAGSSKDAVTLIGQAGVSYKVGTSATDKKAKAYMPGAGKTQVALVPAGASVFALVTKPSETEFDTGATSWSRDDLKLTDEKTKLAITVEPTGQDLPGKNDKITITGVDGIQWKVDGKSAVKVPAGRTSTVVGQSVTAEAVAPLDGAIEGKTSWTAQDLGLTTGAVKVTVTAPTGNNQPGVTKDTVTITGVTGVKYAIGKRTFTPKAGATQTVPMLPTETLTATATTGYEISGTASWTGEALELKNDGASATVTAPTADDQIGKSKDAIIITPAADVIWTVDGVKATVGSKEARISTRGKTSIVVKATGKTADTVVQDADKKDEWKFDFVTDKGELKPAAPTADKDGHAVKITHLEGVAWKVDGKPVKESGEVTTVPVPATKKTVTVTATAQNTTDATVVENASTTLSFE